MSKTIGILTSNIVDSMYGVPLNYHTMERVEIAKKPSFITITFAGYFNKAVSESGALPLARNVLSFQNFDLSSDDTVEVVQNALYERAINPTEDDNDIFASGELVTSEDTE